MERHECNVCYETEISCVILQCEHRLCRYCVTELTSNNHNCPMCNKKIVLLNEKFNLSTEQFHHGNENVNLNLRYIYLTFEDISNNLGIALTHLTFGKLFRQPVNILPNTLSNNNRLQNIFNNIFMKSITFKNLTINLILKIINCFNFKNLFY